MVLEPRIVALWQGGARPPAARGGVTVGEKLPETYSAPFSFRLMLLIPSPLSSLILKFQIYKFKPTKILLVGTLPVWPMAQLEVRRTTGSKVKYERKEF
jgi:hypothetical protein